MAYINLKGAVLSGNAGGGILQVGEGGIIEAEGAMIIGNGGPAVTQREATLMEKLGLPNETDPKELAELLKLLLSIPEGNREAVVEQSSLLAKLKAYAIDGTTVASNIASLASDPHVQQLIQLLSS